MQAPLFLYSVPVLCHRACILLKMFSCLLVDMRKALSRDKERKSVIPLKDPVRPEDIE